MTSVDDIIYQSLRLEEKLLAEVDDEMSSLYPKKEIAKVMRSFRQNDRVSEGMISKLDALHPKVPSPEIWSLLSRNVKKRTRELGEIVTLLDPSLGFNSDPELEAHSVKRQREQMNLYWSDHSKEFRDKVALIVRESIRRGLTVDETASLLERRLELSSNRATRIARDQILKAGTYADSLKQKRLGIRSYRWTTRGDVHVRDSHSERNGKVYLWANTTIEHPGVAIMCRCRAICNI